MRLIPKLSVVSALTIACGHGELEFNDKSGSSWMDDRYSETWTPPNSTPTDSLKTGLSLDGLSWDSLGEHTGFNFSESRVLVLNDQNLGILWDTQNEVSNVLIVDGSNNTIKKIQAPIKFETDSFHAGSDGAVVVIAPKTIHSFKPKDYFNEDTADDEVIWQTIDLPESLEDLGDFFTLSMGNEVFVDSKNHGRWAFHTTKLTWRKIENQSISREEIRISQWSGKELLAWAKYNPQTLWGYYPEADKWVALTQGKLEDQNHTIDQLLSTKNFGWDKGQFKTVFYYQNSTGRFIREARFDVVDRTWNIVTLKDYNSEERVHNPSGFSIQWNDGRSLFFGGLETNEKGQNKLSNKINYYEEAFYLLNSTELRPESPNHMLNAVNFWMGSKFYVLGGCIRFVDSSCVANSHEIWQLSIPEKKDNEVSVENPQKLGEQEPSTPKSNKEDEEQEPLPQDDNKEGASAPTQPA